MADDVPESNPAPQESEPSAFDEGIERLEQLAESARGGHVPEPDEAFAERLATFERQFEEAKARREKRAQEEKRKAKSDQEAARGLGLGLSIAYTIIGLPIFGFAVGWAIDQRLGTELAKGFCVLAGSIVGLTMAIVMLNRANRD